MDCLSRMVDIASMQPFNFDSFQLTLSSNVKAARKARGLSQEKLALEAEVDRTYVSQIERAIQYA